MEQQKEIQQAHSLNLVLKECKLNKPSAQVSEGGSQGREERDWKGREPRKRGERLEREGEKRWEGGRKMRMGEEGEKMEEGRE